MRHTFLQLTLIASLSLSVHASTPTRAFHPQSLSFEANEGHADTQVRFVARASGYTVLFTPQETLFVGAQHEIGKSPIQFRMTLPGANPDARMEGLDPLPTTVNVARGADAQEWPSGIRTYSRVRHHEVYPGVDVLYYGNGQQLEYDFELKAGVDPGILAVQFEGIDSFEIGAAGDLVLKTAAGDIRQSKPVVYQKTEHGRRGVDVSYIRLSENRVGFKLGEYDRGAGLVIDPVLGFSTYLGGAGDDYGNHIAVDRNGNVYVVGSRPSVRGTDYDAYVAKYSVAGRLLWITDVGDTCDDSGRGIAVDAAGNAYITGALGFSCWDSNTRPGAFAAKVNAAGRAVYFYPFSGEWSYTDVGQAIAVDALGHAYITGNTNSRYFPVTARAFQPQLRSQWLGNGFVVKINPQGTALIYATYLGGDTYESANGIAVDAQGSAYITGHTESSDFPTTQNGFQRTRPTMGTGATGFVSKLNRDGSTLVYSTYLGGRFNDVAYGIAIDAAGNAYVTGETESDNFPTTPGSVQPNPGDNRLCYYKLCTDVFVTKLNATGSGLVYSTYLGGRLWETGHRIAVDTQGQAYVTGRTFSADFPLAQAFQLMRRGDQDAFVAKLNAAGSAFVYSSYLGGAGADSGVGIAADLNGNTYVTGVTNSIDFPILNAQQPLPGGGNCWSGACTDGFVVKIGR